MKIPAAVLLILLFSASVNVYAQSATQPRLPEKTVSLVLPLQGTSTCPTLTTGANCVRTPRPGNAIDFQNAINAATCGDTIVLAAGSTYSGNFTIPQTTCTNNSGWIVMESSAMGSLPVSGNRVGPSNASNMAIISTPTVGPAIAFLPGSNHWRLMGLEITTSFVNLPNTVYFLVATGLQSDNSTYVSAISQLPSYIIFDRDLILGLRTSYVTSGILFNAVYQAIVDSYCDEIHIQGFDSQCFAGYNGPGPYLIQNNFIEAGTENIMFGGSDPAITNLVPSDITVIGNLIQKNTTWRNLSSPFAWGAGAKNLFELKNAQRVLLDGNVLQYTWAAGQNEAIIIRSVDQGGTCTWCVVQDVTITHNRIQHVPIGIVIANSLTDGDVNPATQRVLVQNNLFTDIDSASWGSGGQIFKLSISATPQAHDWIIDHNTGFSDHNAGIIGDSGTIQNFQFTNNILDYGNCSGCGGIFGSGIGSGAVALSTFAPGYIYKDVVFATTTTNTYPLGTFWSTNLAGVGFTSYSGTDPNLTGNFQLTSGSAYHDTGTDGKDIGVWDWTCLNSDSAAALAGNFVPSPECTVSGNPLAPPTKLAPPANLKAEVQ